MQRKEGKNKVNNQATADVLISVHLLCYYMVKGVDFMKVTVYSRKAVESLLRNGFPENTAVISFYDPIDRRNKNDYAPVDYSGKVGRVFYVPIYDIDIEVLGDFGLTYETYFPEVNVLAKFIDKAKNNGMDIICQCEYGQSRSAGCAAAILEHYYKNGISIFADYRYYPNQLIYHKVFDALKNL